MGNEKSIVLLNVIHSNVSDIELVQRLIHEGADVNFQDIAGNTPLSLAIQNSNQKVVDVLLARPEINVNKKDENGSTPLHFAVARGYLNVVENLIKKGSYFDVENNEGHTPLHYSNENQQVYIFLSNINQLFNAAREGKLDKVNDLIKKGTYINAKNKDGATPLHWAAQYSNKEVVEALLARPEININAQDNSGQTPLDLAIDGEIKVLLRSKRYDNNGLTNKQLTQPIDNDDIQLQQDDNRESLHPIKPAIKDSSNEQLAPSTSGFILWSFWSNTGKMGEHIQQSYIPLVKLNIYDYDSQND